VVHVTVKKRCFDTYLGSFPFFFAIVIVFLLFFILFKRATSVLVLNFEENSVMSHIYYSSFIGWMCNKIIKKFDGMKSFHQHEQNEHLN